MAQECSVAVEFLNIDCVEFNEGDQTAIIDVTSRDGGYVIFTTQALASIEFTMLEEKQMKARFSQEMIKVNEIEKIKNRLMEIENLQENSELSDSEWNELQEEKEDLLYYLEQSQMKVSFRQIKGG